MLFWSKNTNITQNQTFCQIANAGIQVYCFITNTHICQYKKIQKWKTNITHLDAFMPSSAFISPPCSCSLSSRSTLLSSIYNTMDKYKSWMTSEKAEKVLKHIKETAQGFCYVDGIITTADDCNRAIYTIEEIKQMHEYNNK